MKNIEKSIDSCFLNDCRTSTKLPIKSQLAAILWVHLFSIDKILTYEICRVLYCEEKNFEYRLDVGRHQITNMKIFRMTLQLQVKQNNSEQRRSRYFNYKFKLKQT